MNGFVLLRHKTAYEMRISDWISDVCSSDLINYDLLLEERTDQLWRLEHQASSAQLAMLRYKLNPHFLFNTLNSISTLVLLKQTDRANAMLSRLSSFLRY